MFLKTRNDREHLRQENHQASRPGSAPDLTDGSKRPAKVANRHAERSAIGQFTPKAHVERLQQNQ